MNLKKLMNLKFDEPEKNCDQFDEPKHLIKFDEPEIDEPEKIDEPKHLIKFDEPEIDESEKIDEPEIDEPK